MRLVILVCQLVLILRTEAQMPSECIGHETLRRPENTDINVVCGTEHMDMSIYLCPVYMANYNSSLMFLNNEFTKSECSGVPDLTADPPVLKFSFPINAEGLATCNNKVKIFNMKGTGEFSDFSQVQYVNISGKVTSMDPSGGTITYREQIMYLFSCLYPMQYMLNNTQLGVSGVNLNIRDNNGSFISTLSMQLFNDGTFSVPLELPESGINLKTKVFVRVKATNLTNRFNVLLDRCYATTTPYPEMVTYYDLFVACIRDPQTLVELNGVSQEATFRFEAFRFVEHKNLTVSTFYLHCITRLCEVDSCASLMPNCTGQQRRRREAPTTTVTENVTVSSPPIYVTKFTSVPENVASPHGVDKTDYSSPVVAVIVCIVILAVIVLILGVFFGVYMRHGKPLIN
ncbi:hypothetical protein LDENG_00275010 [Lucifuga dentata]|nr:hypothetical protein LDENG_00275010 [Lucifuga dentata]